MAGTREAEGFQGAVAGLSLADVIQLNGNNGFSGCITVQYGAQLGRVFFREGKIIHAEQGGKIGEDAFYDILAWRAGHFSLEPNVSTTSFTIKKSSQFVLMEAYRLMDERRARSQEKDGPQAPESLASGASKPIAERLRSMPGVAYAVLMGGNGSCVDDASPDAAALAGRAAYLAMIGNQIGAILGAGQLVSAAVHTTDASRRVFVVARQDHYLGALVESDAELVSVEAGVRRLLGEG